MKKICNVVGLSKSSGTTTSSRRTLFCLYTCQRKLAVATVSILVFASGCQSPTRISERYTRPAEVNMAGRENVVVEPVEGGNRSAAMLTGRIKGALSGRGFNVLERDAWDIMRRERTLGSASGANIESASVLIKGGYMNTRLINPLNRQTS